MAVACERHDISRNSRHGEIPFGNRHVGLVGGEDACVSPPHTSLAGCGTGAFDFCRSTLLAAGVSSGKIQCFVKMG